MTTKKGEIKLKEITKKLKGSYSGEPVLEKLSISKESLEKAVQEVYHSDTCKSSWYGVDTSSISKLYADTRIAPKYTKKELEEFDKKMAKSVSHTTGFGIGHQDAGHYVPYKEIKDLIPLEQLPEFKQTVHECYERSVDFCPLDFLCLYVATEIKPDIDSLAEAKGVEKQEMVDGLYTSAKELSKRWGVGPELVYEISGMLPSQQIQETLLTDYLKQIQGEKK